MGCDAKNNILSYRKLVSSENILINVLLLSVGSPKTKVNENLT
jgi:hypothetical protein